MKIIVERLYNRLVPTEKEFLVSKEDLQAKSKAIENKEEFEVGYVKEVFLPKSITLDYCISNFVEIDKPLEKQNELQN